jgi:hypothetical protein
MIKTIKRENEIPLRDFVAQEADREKKSEAAIHQRIKRGYYKLKIRRHNPRVVFVSPA